MADRISGTDTSLYTGDINFIDIPSNQRDYWRIPLQGMMVQGEQVDVIASHPITAELAVHHTDSV